MAKKKPPKYIQGLYKPRHPNKYKGNIHKIVYRSSYELQFMNYCDNSPSILEWASEEIAIPYLKPTDKRIHTYYLDFWIKYVSNEYERNPDYWEKIDILKLKPHQQEKAKLIIEGKSNLTPYKGKELKPHPNFGDPGTLYLCTTTNSLFMKKQGNILINENGYKVKKVKKAIIEIKPENQVQMPKKQQRITTQYKKKVMTWCVNQAKWESAQKYADKHNMEFKIITEKFLKNAK